MVALRDLLPVARTNSPFDKRIESGRAMTMATEIEKKAKFFTDDGSSIREIVLSTLATLSIGHDILLAGRKEPVIVVARALKKASWTLCSSHCTL